MIAGIGAALAAPSLAQAAPCGLDGAAPPSPSALNTCLLAHERGWGPDDPRLLGLLEQMAQALAISPRGAVNALPYRRRAYRLASRLYGDEAASTAQAALSYAQAWLLSGHCAELPPPLRPLLDAARDGFMALGHTDTRRDKGLRAVAAAYADGLLYRDAAEALSSVQSGNAAARDLIQRAEWQLLAGEPEAAIAAFEQALPPASEQERSEIMRSLGPLLFERGELERLAVIRSHYNMD
ncbi:MAG: hypothetical protein MRY63_06925 [Neomegalonema sp.]|nr:hypothetical protein [Neomegalonema sp.]